MCSSRVVLGFGGVLLCFLEAGVTLSAAEWLAIPIPPIDPEKRPLPSGAIARLGSLRLRHEDEVRSIAFSPDGKMIASVSQSGPTVRVWDTFTGRLLHEFNTPGIFSRDIFAPTDYSFAFTPDGRGIAAGVRADVCFWDLQSGREVRRFRGKGGCITALRFAHDNKTFYCGGSDNHLCQWDLAMGKRIQSWNYFQGKGPRVYASGFREKTATLKAVAPDGKTAVWVVQHREEEGTAVSVKGVKLMVWDVTSGKDRCEIKDENGKDFFDPEVVLSRDGKFLTAFTRNNRLIVWDTATGKKREGFGPGDYVEAVAYSPDCRRIATIARTRGYRLSVWDLASCRELWGHEITVWYAPGWDKLLTFAPDGKTVALAHWNNVRIWGVESGEEMPVLTGHRWPVRKLAFSPDGSTLISADDASVCEWSTAGRQTARHPLLAYHGASRSLAESYGMKLRLYQPDGRPPQVRELVTDKLIYQFDDVKGTCYNGRFSADGRAVSLALALDEKKTEVVFIDLPSRRVRSRITIDERIGAPLAVSGDGRMLAAPRWDQTVALIDSFRGKVVARLGTPRAPPGEKAPRTVFTAGAFSPDGQLLAFGTRVERPGRRHQFGLDDLPPDSPGIRVWQVATGRELPQFADCLKDAHHGGIEALRFSPDNKSLAVALTFNPWHPGDLDQAAVPVLEVASGRIRRTFKGHTDHVISLAFSRDGKVLVTGSKDSTILLWDMRPPCDVNPGLECFALVCSG